MQIATRTKSILVVDGGREFCLTIELAFRRLRQGTAVWLQHDGQSAIEHLAFCGQRHPVPDLLLVNRVLPGERDGYSVVRAVRALEKLGALPTIIMGGSEDREDFLLAQAAGADGYLRQPPEKTDYAAWAQQVLVWPEQKSWSEHGLQSVPGPLPFDGHALQCHPMHAITAAAPAFLESSDNRTFSDRFFDALGWMTRKSEESVDPWQLALSRVCRKHHLTTVQFRKTGGSQSLTRCRRAAMVELLAEGWPEETLLAEVAISGTDMKRLRAALREKIGPKLD